MKKLLFLCLIFIVSCQLAVAQRPTGISPAAWDEMIANRAVRLSISASKTLLESNEHTNLVINILVPPQMGEDGIPTDMPGEVPLPAGSESPYRATNWKILHGGGNLIGIDAITYDYAAPPTAPADKTMTISVDLMPTRPNFPKVVLLQTLYFTDNETAVYVNLPAVGFNNSKYVAKMNGGVNPTMQGMDPRAAAQMSPDLQAKMAQAQAAMRAAQQSSGINLSAVSSNAMALYDADHNLTAVKIMPLSLQMSDGRTVAGPSGETILFNFSFKGKGVGSYPLTQNDVGVVFGAVVGPKKGGCGNNQRSPSGKDMHCTGSVTINSMDDKIIKGTINTAIYTSLDGKTILRGYLYGKFAVNRAN